MNILKRITYIAFGILISIVVLLTSVEMVAFNRNHYEKSFEKYHITEATGMDMKNLMHTIEDVLLYLKDDRQELDTKAVIHGEERLVFGERETLHMVDVKGLFINGRILRNISVAFIAILTFFMIKKDKSWSKRLGKTLLYAAICNVILLGILFVLLYIDFYKYFTYFHLIFFNNDLWVLNPKTDVLIQMVPEAFFYDTAVKIITYFIGSLVASGFIGLYLVKKNKSLNR